MWIVVDASSKVAGLINYDFDKREEGVSTLIHSNLSMSDNRMGTIHMFDHFKSQSYRTVKDPFIVGTVNLHPDESLSDKDLANVAKSYLENIGLSSAPVYMSVHNDRRHKHLHFIVSRTDILGKTTNMAGHFFKKDAKEVSNYFNQIYGFNIISREFSDEKSVSHAEAAVSQYSILRYLEKQEHLDAMGEEIVQDQLTNEMIEDKYPVSFVQDLQSKSKPVSYMDNLKEILNTAYDAANTPDQFFKILDDNEIYARVISDTKNIDRKIIKYGIVHQDKSQYVHESRLPTKFNNASIHQLAKVKSGQLKAYSYAQQKTILKRLLHKSRKHSQDFSSFMTHSKSLGVTIDLHYSGGKINGYVASLDVATESLAMKASSIDRQLSISNLNKHLQDHGIAMVADLQPTTSSSPPFEIPISGSSKPHQPISDEEDIEERIRRKRKGKTR